MLENGEDFEVSVSRMRQQIYERARSRGVKVRTHVDAHGNIYLQRMGTNTNYRQNYHKLLAEIDDRYVEDDVHGVE